MDINHDLYRVFFYVVQNGSFTKAAEKLMVSQSAITQSIKKLEYELGGKLFIRSKSGVTLTYEGEKLYEYIVNSVEVLNHAEDIFSQYRELEKGSIRIACGSTLSYIFLLDKLEIFCKRYPNIKISVINDRAGVAIKKLMNGECDVVITSLNTSLQFNNCSVYEVCTTQDCFFTTKEYYETVMNKKDDISDIDKYTLMLPASNTNYRDIVDKQLNNRNITVNSNYEFSSCSILVNFIKKMGGIGVAPREFINKELESGKLVEIYKSIELNEKPVGVITLNKKLVGKAVNQFIKILIEKL